jgi:hypothetical protein
MNLFIIKKFMTLNNHNYIMIKHKYLRSYVKFGEIQHKI